MVIFFLLQKRRQALKSESDSTGIVAQGTDSVSTPVDELRKRLKETSDSIPPSIPSLCVYAVNRSGGQWCVHVYVCACVCVCEYMRVCVCACACVCGVSGTGVLYEGQTFCNTGLRCTTQSLKDSVQVNVGACPKRNWM